MSQENPTVMEIIVFVVVFLTTWITCAVFYGGLGVMLGWMPAVFLATIVAAAWPFFAMIAVVLGMIVAGFFLDAKTKERAARESAPYYVPR